MENTMELIAKALESVVEQKVAEKTQEVVGLDSVLEFIRNSSGHERELIMKCLEDFHQDTLDEYYYSRLEGDSFIINKDELTVEDVENAGILEDCYNEYLDNACDIRETIKDLVDRI